MSSGGAVADASRIGTAEHVLVPRLVEAAQVSTLPDGRLRFGSADASATLPSLPAGLTGILAGLVGNTRCLSEMFDVVAETDGPAMLGMAFAHLARLSTQGLLTHHLIADGKELASIEPTGINYRFLALPVVATRPIQLSHFSMIHRDGDYPILESGLSSAVIHVQQPALLSLLALLMTETTPEALTRACGALEISADTVAGLLVLLMNGNHLATETETGDDHLRLWSPHDLLFHMRSRFGRMGGHYGGNFRHIGEIEPAPAVRPLPSDTQVPLPVPVLEELLREDPPFQLVVEQRRSVYSYDRTPITLDDLGEFLYRVARVRWLDTMPVSSPETRRNGAMEISSRPVPAGGRGYELELYLTVDRCQGLDPGMYHYDPAGHQLSLVRPADERTEQMLAYAGIASPGTRPQVLITMAARFQRMMWKYDRLAYAATLKHVGVMMQQMYLAATVMQLAPSAQGSGNLEVFAAATGNDPVIEGSVGEFILGSSAAGARAHRPRMLYPDGQEAAT